VPAGFDRRQILGAAVAAPMVNKAEYQPVATSGRRYARRVVDLVRENLVIDMLGVLAIDYRPESFGARLSPAAAAEFKASGITVFHHSAGTSGPTAREDALQWIAQAGVFVGRNDDRFLIVEKVSDFDRAKAAGKAAVILGLQNAEHFRGPDDVKLFYQLGQRCSQLTYNAQNLLGSGSTERVDGGVSDYGEAIIKAMNAVGMLVDVSHSGERTTLDAASLSTKPIAITHSNCRALIDHPRCKSDAAIRAVAAKGGVMGVTGVRNFVRATEPTNVGHMVDHIDHIVRLVGIEHAGIGSDADLHGYDDLPADLYEQLKASYKTSYAFRGKIDTDGFDHPLKMFDLTEELVRRDYSNAAIAAILGGNFRRLLGQTWL